MKNTIKRHLISFVITFTATFLLILFPAVIVGNINMSILIAAIIAASRSAVKIAWEFAIVPLLHILLEFSKKLINK